MYTADVINYSIFTTQRVSSRCCWTVLIDIDLTLTVL